MKQVINRNLVILLLASFEGFSSQVFSGDVSFYNKWHRNLGSCRLERSMSNPFRVAALSKELMESTSKHQLCSERSCVQLFGKRGSVVLKVSDTCKSCNDHDIEVAHVVFPLLADPKRGRVQMTWTFVDCQSNLPGRRA